MIDIGTLVINRKEGEAFIVGDGDRELCRVEVVSRSKGRVTLKIEAPKNIKILREEILTKGDR